MFDLDFIYNFGIHSRFSIQSDPFKKKLVLINIQAPTGLLRVEFIGWIPTEEKPTSLSFRGDCYLRSDMVGSILTLVFASGQIENIPLLYVHPADHDMTSRQRLAFEDITHSELNSVTLGDSKSFW